MDLPVEMATEYYYAGADEILIMDAVASLYDRNNLFDIIEETCKSVFISVCLGGEFAALMIFDLRLTVGPIRWRLILLLLEICLIGKAAKIFGAQAIVGSVEAKRSAGDYFCYYDNGREPTEVKVVEWVKLLKTRARERFWSRPLTRKEPAKDSIGN